MGNNSQKLLFDILTSINNIDRYLGVDKTYDRYDSTPMLEDAVERNIEIIGEAVSRLLKIEPDI